MFETIQTRTEYKVHMYYSYLKTLREDIQTFKSRDEAEAFIKENTELFLEDLRINHVYLETKTTELIKI